MSGSSKKRLPANRTKAALRRPFDSRLVLRARDIVDDYRVILERDDDLGYVGCSIEMPNVYADGRTADECVASVREALIGAVAFMLEDGRQPPVSSNNKRRTAQVNVRLTAEEKLLLEDRAKREGYRGLSDYIRAASLFDTRKSA